MEDAKLTNALLRDIKKMLLGMSFLLLATCLFSLYFLIRETVLTVLGVYAAIPLSILGIWNIIRAYFHHDISREEEKEAL